MGLRTGTILLVTAGIWTGCGQRSETAAIVLGDGVPVQARADGTGETRGTLQEGSEVTVLGFVGEPQRIGRLTGRWARIRGTDGSEGFVFDAWLFPVAALYDGDWIGVAPDGAGVLRYTFGQDGQWVNEVADPYRPAEYGALRFGGRFSRHGRELRLVPDRPAPSGTGGETNRSLWLHRTEGRPVLAGRRQQPGERPEENEVYLARENP